MVYNWLCRRQPRHKRKARILLRHPQCRITLHWWTICHWWRQNINGKSKIMDEIKKSVLAVLSTIAISGVALAQNGAFSSSGDPPIAVGYTATPGTPYGVEQWTEFQFGAVGSFSDDYTYTSSSPTDILVTDSFEYGDQFAVYDNGNLLGDTSIPGTGSETSRGDTSWTLPYSKGVFAGYIGANDIEIEAIASPFGGGGAYLEVENGPSAPDGGMAGLMLSGAIVMMGALGGKLRE